MNETATEANALETVEVGDVLIIGFGEKATRHPVTEAHTNTLWITPEFGGTNHFRAASPGFFSALLERGALSIEKKPKPKPYKKAYELKPCGADSNLAWSTNKDADGFVIRAYGADARALRGQPFRLTIEIP